MHHKSIEHNSMEGLSVAFAQRARTSKGVEWPTIGVSVTIYAAWLLLTFFYAKVPAVVLFVLGGCTIAWHSSFQHEVVHGHPTPWRRVNNFLAWPPLSLWLPFDSYRISHQSHHVNERLTDPLSDPESKYWTLEDWRRLPIATRLIESIQSILLGRLIVGPLWMISRFLTKEARAIIKGDWATLRTWFWHSIAVAILLFWLSVCHMGLTQYIAYFVYPGTAILLLRSFTEHRFATDYAQRSAIIESSSVFGLLFLNNNLHAVHHKYPGAPWYELPAIYYRERSRFLQMNGGFLHQGYVSIIKDYLFRPNDQIIHPSSQ